jgi:hypothetical protein
LRRWLLAIVVILGISTVIAAESESLTSASTGGELPSTGVGGMASASAGIEGVVPIPARVVTPAGFERGLRVKVPLMVGPGAATLAGVAARRRKGYRHQTCRLSLAQRAWSFRRRGPPLLLPLA